jgi:3-phosphoshikimate 1-carboxyvinyltransferase
MSFLVCGLASAKPITVTGCETINTSFPRFAALMQAIGSDIAAPKETV